MWSLTLRWIKVFENQASGTNYSSNNTFEIHPQVWMQNVWNVVLNDGPCLWLITHFSLRAYFLFLWLKHGFEKCFLQPIFLLDLVLPVVTRQSLLRCVLSISVMRDPLHPPSVCNCVQWVCFASKSTEESVIDNWSLGAGDRCFPQYQHVITLSNGF